MRILSLNKKKMRISKEKLLLEREKFKYLKSIHSDYNDILNNIDYNVMRLREEIEKIASSYLT